MKIVDQRLLIALTVVAVLQSCEVGPGHDNKISETQGQNHSAVTETNGNRPGSYSVYLENSGSLNGYLSQSGPGSFKDAVYTLLADINGLPPAVKTGLNLYDINTRIIPVAMDAGTGEVDNYISKLDAQTFRQRSAGAGGDQSQSDLSRIFRQVLDSSSGNGVSIVISDCIFSPDEGDAIDFLSKQRATIQGYFHDKIGAGISTLVLKFTADFNGVYYYQNNTASKPALFPQRPYYLVAIGPEAALRALHDQVDRRLSGKGYQDFLFVTPQSDYDVSARVAFNGEYYDQDAEQKLLVTRANAGGPDNKFRLFINVDLAAIPVAESYLRNPANYSLSPGYRVEKVMPRSDAGNNTTHQLVLVSDRATDGKASVSLKAQMPQWVQDTQLDSDLGLSPESLANKTFGIKYLMEGIWDAYYSARRDPAYFSVSVTVKN